MNVILCDGGSIFVEGVEYDDTNTPDTIVTGNPSFHGCDSTINITLSYYPTVENYILDTLCFGGSLMINNEEYNAGNPF